MQARNPAIDWRRIGTKGGDGEIEKDTHAGCHPHGRFMGMGTTTLTLRLIIGAAALFPAAVAAQSTNQSADPRLLALSCAGCHGPGGHSDGAIPSIDGRDAASLAAALRGFRDGQRPSTVMGRVAKAYSDSEIDALAREIASGK